MTTIEQSERRRVLFLRAFAEHGNVTAACRVAGIGRTIVYEWKEHDPAFAEAYQRASDESLENLEGEAYRRAVVGVRSEKGVYHQGQLVGIETKVEWSDGLLMFLLKARNPAKYRENATLEHTGPGGQPLPPVQQVVLLMPPEEPGNTLEAEVTEIGSPLEP